MSNKTNRPFHQEPNCICLQFFVAEFTVVFITNAFTLIVFARSRQLRKRTMYLIINLTVADLLVGAVTGPLDIYTSHIEHGDGFRIQTFIILTLSYVFVGSSMVNLFLIALERLHATLYPFRHCLLTKQFYYKVGIFGWISALLLAFLEAGLYLHRPIATPYLWQSFTALILIVITISYSIIAFKLRSNPPPQYPGAAFSNNKLSVTLFIVTVVFTLSILPWTILLTIPRQVFTQLFATAGDCVTETVAALYYANFIVNPLIYAIRMQPFRKAVKELICKKSRNLREEHPLNLHGM